MLRKILFLSWIALMMCSCSKTSRDVNVSDIDVNLDIKRFDKELFEADPSRIGDLIPVLKEKYGRFFQIFNHRITGIGSDENPSYSEYLKAFVTDYLNFQIYQRTTEVFPDMDFIRTELEDAFKHYKHYFPDMQIPEIITYVSGINQSVISDSLLLGIGLDDYLGVDEPLYRQLGIYQYLAEVMYKERIATDCMRLWAMTEFPYNDSVNNLVSNMIYEGMLMYFADRMIPDRPDTLKWGFTASGMSFCRDNEKQMWAYLIENRLLFNSERFTIDKFTSEGPFTKDFSSESPGRAAVWIGYRIVHSYMDHHKEIGLDDLMKERDYQRILNESFYNP
ncbi:MAG TPA: hypothetical protein VJ346_02535 [Bacteroidales bacterium]|nr:hypothetical protein [Bacteroidales bacterium]